MAKHIILTDVALSAADVILATKTTLPQVIGSLAADTYSVRNTSAPISGTVTDASSDWWTANSVIDIDYANDRARINGVSYASLAAARTAGILVTNANGDDTVSLSEIALGETYVLAGSGRTPAAANNGYIAALDDGTTSNMVYIGISTTGTSKAGGWFAGGTSRLAQSTSTITLDAAYRAACRVKSGAGLLSFNGTAGTSGTNTNLPSGLATLVVGDRTGNDRGWTGTINRVVLVNADLTDAQVHALLAA